MLLSGSRSDADAGVTACAGPFGLHDGLMSATGDNLRPLAAAGGGTISLQEKCTFEWAKTPPS